jgi:hypothetical protein
MMNTTPRPTQSHCSCCLARSTLAGRGQSLPTCLPAEQECGSAYRYALAAAKIHL